MSAAEASGRRFFAPQAWVQGAWRRDVVLTVDGGGCWSSLDVEAPAERRRGATALGGPVLPGLVDAHSHAFQRAIAGLAERSGGTGDDFWRWRDRMYAAALRITPGQLESIATMLYAELLAGGYTQVCEFHYVHNAPDGKAYADPLAMSLALVRAAQRVGMGLTLLPTLYMRAGFGADSLREEQRRFACSPDGIVRLIEGVQRQAAGLVNLGVAVHSLRAADGAAIRELTDHSARVGLPVHIHVAEQIQEVEDCLAHTGRRPIEWLLQHLRLDERWNLVHATHATASELQGVSERGAAIVLCPSTEANLGDGVFDYPAWAAAGGRWSIGSDSHVTRGWPEELRLLEYGQRLTHRKRNVAAASAGSPSSASVLFESALAAGQSACGLPVGSMAVGRRADFLVLDAESPALLGVPVENTLDALIFSSPGAAFREVRVAGSGVLAAPTASAVASPRDWQQIRQDFARTMRALWA